MLTSLELWAVIESVSSRAFTEFCLWNMIWVMSSQFVVLTSLLVEAELN